MLKLKPVSKILLAVLVIAALIQKNQEGTLVPLLAGAGAIAKTKCEYSSYSKLMYMR